MNKIKKIAFTLGTFSPVLYVVACGQEKMDPKTIYVQAEKNWIPTYQKIINDFKTDNQDLMENNDIKNIKIVELGSFDTETRFKNKGINDVSTPDLFLIASDKANFFIQNDYLKPYSTNNPEQFLVKNAAEGADYVDGADKINKAMIHNEKLYGVAENVEAMVQMNLKEGYQEATPPKIITKFSDLWMSAGFFNKPETTDDDGFNLRDIVYTDENKGKYRSVLIDNKYSKGTISSLNEAEAAIKDGFKNILMQIRNLKKDAKGELDQDAFDVKSDKATPKVFDFLKANKKDTAIFAGPWDFDDIKEKIGEDIIAKQVPTTWNQWGGGWAYGMNARIKDTKREVIEKLIGWFYDAKYAQDMFEGVGKVSPINLGKKIIAKESTTNNSIPHAVYNTSVMDKPVDNAFNDVGVWDSYANLMNQNKNYLASLEVSKGDLDLTSKAEELYKDFKDAIIKSINDKNEINN